MLRSCSIAEEYVNARNALIIDDRMHLPSGERIPNDSSGQGLKYTIDSWLSANRVRQDLCSIPSTQRPPLATFTALFTVEAKSSHLVLM